MNTNMKPKTRNQPACSRRDILKLAGLATASLAGTATLLKAQETVRRGSAPVKINLYANDKPGLGIDIDETLAAKFPYKSPGGSRGNDRRLDGTIVRP